MHRSKIISLLATCNGHELKRFRVFLNSPYFNQYPEVLVLFDHLKAHWPEFGAGIEKESIFQFVWPEEPFNAAQLRHLTSRLCQLLETFWSVQAVMKDPFEKDRLLLNTFEDRNLDKYFLQTLNQLEEKLKGGVQRDSVYHFRRFQLAQASHSYTIHRQNRQLESSIENVLEALDTWYFSRKLMFSCAAINRQNILSIQSDLGFLKEIQQHLTSVPKEIQPVVEVYLRILEFLEDVNQEEAYQRLLVLLETHKQAFPQEELSVMYAFALNYCIRQLNLGKADYLAKLFDLYLLVVEEQLLFIAGYLPPQHFKNIVTVGLRLARFEEVQQFVAASARYVPVPFRENATIYSHAELHFYQEEYGESLRLLQEVEFTDVFYHLDAKSLLLKTYYELFDPDPLFSLVDAFRVYLRRNRKISDYQRTIYRNLVKFTNWLMRARLGDRRILRKLTQEMASSPDVSSLVWLQAKLEELTPSAN